MNLMSMPPDTVTDSDDSLEVLYFEDDPELAELYQLKLELDGYRVRMVPLQTSPPAAISGRTPELLFVDIRSRTQQGLDSVAAWRADRRFRDVPAVMFSALDRRELEARGIQLGELDQLVIMRQPFSPHQGHGPQWSPA